MVKTLFEMKDNAAGRVLEIQGGRGLAAKLERLGLRAGTRVVKISHASGPVLVMAGAVELAIGRGMAAKVIVEQE